MPMVKAIEARLPVTDVKRSAEFYVDVGKAKQARWFAQEAVRRQPTVKGYEFLANTCRLVGDNAAANAALEMARKLKGT